MFCLVVLSILLLAVLLDSNVFLRLARRIPNYYAGKVIVITGASSGIGRAFALRVAQNTSEKTALRFVLLGRKAAALRQTREALVQLGVPAEQVHCLEGDLGHTAGLRALAARVQECFGHVDILVNNAGVTTRSSLEALDVDAAVSVVDQVLAVDLKAPLLLSKFLLPGMLTRGSGHIVNVASVAGKYGAPLRTVYSAAKFGLIGAFDALRAEVGARGLHVTNVCPGPTQT
ncbi:MAG: hypothetical protein MHM6MM_009081, partial [Cercozoa sp. M6MM]